MNLGQWSVSYKARRLAAWLRVSDPGLQRLRSAVRVPLVVVAAALVSYLIARGSTVAPIFGGIVGLLATMVVRDDELKQRKITTLLLFLPTSLSAALGAFLASLMWLEALALLVIVFFVLYLRRFGPRYTALGMMALIPLFLSSFVQFGVGQLPWIIVAAAVGVACAYLFRFLLIQDRPEIVLRRSIAAFDLQLGLVLDVVADTVEDRRGDKGRRKKLRREARRLNNCATAAEVQLSSEDSGLSPERSNRLRLYLFDAEMSANTLSEIAWRYATSEYDFPSEVRDSLLRALRELRATLQSADAGSKEALRALDELERSRERAASGEDLAGWFFQARRAVAAIRRLSECAGEGRDPEPTERQEEEESGNEEEDRRRQRGGLVGKLRPTTVQGIQATLASGLALLAGEVFSSSRPYWVVITAFIVFMGSGTLGDTLSRGFQRTVGTLLGAVVGFFLASIASGNLYLEVLLMLVSIFLAFYLFAISYAMMMFWVTVVLAVAYGFMGRLDSGILALRFFDTLVGSVIGLAVSALVLPTKTSDRICEGSAEFLDALKDYVRDRLDRLAGGGDPFRHSIEEAREVESKLQEVTGNATTAKNQAMVFGRSRTDLDRWTTALMALSYYARHLAGPVSRGQRFEEDRNQQDELLREVGERIAANLDSLSEAILNGKRPGIQDIEDLMERLENDPSERAARGDEASAEDASSASPALAVSPGRAGLANVLHYLRRINHTLGELATILDPGNK